MEDHTGGDRRSELNRKRAVEKTVGDHIEHIRLHIENLPNMGYKGVRRRVKEADLRGQIEELEEFDAEMPYLKAIELMNEDDDEISEADE